MSNTLGGVVVEVSTDTKKLTTGLNYAGDKVDKFAKQGVHANQKLSASFREAAASVSIIQGPLGPVAGRLSAIGAAAGRVNPLLIGASVAVAGLGIAAVKSVSAGIALETQMSKLNAIVKSTGGSAGLSAAAINEFARQLGEDTLTSASAVRDASGVLLTFRSISGDTFKETLRLAQDLSATGFGDLKTTTLQLGKALEEPLIGITALRRSGVSFTDAQKDMIKSMVDTGNQLGAQRIILDAVNQQVGGAGVAAAAGLAGAWDTLGERMTRLFEQAAKGTGIMGGLAKAVTWVSDSINQTLIPLENAEKAQRLWTEQIQPNIAAFQALGINIDTIRPDNLIQVSAALKDIAARGIDINRLDSDTAALQAQYVTFSATLENAKRAIDAMRAAKVTDIRAFESQKKIIEELTPAVKVLGDYFYNTAAAQNATAASTQDLDAQFAAAILQEEQNIATSDAHKKRMDALIKSANPLSEAIRVQADNVAYLTERLNSGGISLGLFQELMAGMAFAHPDLVTPATPTFDTAGAADRLVGLQNSLMTEQEAVQASYDARQFIIEDAYQALLINQQDYNDLTLRNEQQLTMDQRQEFYNRMQLAANFFNGFAALAQAGGKKTFGLWKALAIAETLVSTYSAAQKAFESQIIPGDPSSPARGYIAAAAAVAGGLARLAAIKSASVGGGGGGAAGGGGGGAGGVSGTPTSGPLPGTSPPAPSGPTVIFNNYGTQVGAEQVTQWIADGVKEAANYDMLTVEVNGQRGRVF